MITPANLLSIDPLSRWPRQAPLFDSERSKALERQAKKARKARRREEAGIVRSLELVGAELRRVLQEAEAELQRSRRGNPALEMLLGTAERYEQDKRRRELQQRRTKVTADFRRLRAQFERDQAVRVTGHVCYGEWWRETGADGRTYLTCFAPGAFRGSIQRHRQKEEIELMVDHTDPLRLIGPLSLVETRSGIHLSARIARSEPALWRLKKMREVSAGFAAQHVESDRCVNPSTFEELRRIRSAHLFELSIVDKSACPGSRVCFLDPCAEAVAS